MFNPFRWQTRYNTGVLSGRFQPVKSSRNGLHSTGAINVTLVNNPETLHFLPEEMNLVILIPGYSKPTTAQLNGLISPLIEEFIRLYDGAVSLPLGLYTALLCHGYVGIDVHVPGHAKEQYVSGTLYVDISELPATRKFTGTRGHTAEDWMCPWFNMPMSSLTYSRCFDRASAYIARLSTSLETSRPLKSLLCAMIGGA